MVGPTPQQQVAHGGISGSATQGDFVKPHLGPQATLPRGLFTISASPERCPRQMQQWLPLSLCACLSQAVHNPYPCAQCLTHWPPATLLPSESLRLRDVYIWSLAGAYYYRCWSSCRAGVPANCAWTWPVLLLPVPTIVSGRFRVLVQLLRSEAATKGSAAFTTCVL